MQLNPEQDDKAQTRKADHISLAFESQVFENDLDTRFNYEPLLHAHPSAQETLPIHFAGKQLKFPVWVSSMTGGTQFANTINTNLAKACRHFGLGMGLGSCRQLLHDTTHLSDFDVRTVLGDDLPLYANLGIAQLEQAPIEKVKNVVHLLRADGLIIHVNPLQEFLQPEGDTFAHAPITTIKRVLDKVDFPVIVKEVGQGMGPRSLEALMQLPLEAIEFGAAGGTNFSKLELQRSTNDSDKLLTDFMLVGHTAIEMTIMARNIADRLGAKLACKQFIISGGVRNFLDGYFLINQLPYPAVYGQASAFLRTAKESYEKLHEHIETQMKGLLMAQACLEVKKY